MAISYKVAIIGAVISCCLLSTQAAEQERYLVHEGEAQAEIVIADSPPRMVKLAAAELQTYIQRITGANLPIVTQPTDQDTIQIYVGRSTATDQLDITDEGLAYGAYRMVSGDRHLVLLGHDSDFTPQQPYMRNGAPAEVARVLEAWDELTGETWGFPFGNIHKEYNRELGIWEKDQRGSLNAVYAFLRDLGVRWYLPDELGEIIPSLTSIALPALDITVHPDFAMRFPYQYGRMFAHNHTTRDEALWQLRMGFSKAPDIIGDMDLALNHGIARVHGREAVKQAHPEYFMLANGKRDTETFSEGRPCLSSEGLFQANVRFVRAMFDLVDAPMVSVMPQDGYASICECELCLDKATPERGWNGQMSDYVWSYVDRVAREVYETHPDRLVSCLAYGTYQLPPETIDQLSPNLAVGIAQGRLRDEAPDVYYHDLRQAWLDKLPTGNKKLWLWEYYLYGRPHSPYAHMPAIFPRAIARDLRALKGISMGEFMEVYRTPKGMASLGATHLNLYVTARLWWDADLDLDALLTEYYTLYYGPAREEMKTFLEFAEAHWRNLRKQPETIAQLLDLLAKAEAAAPSGSTYARRIKLMTDYVAPLRALQEQLAKGRENVPIATTIDRDSRDIVLDGRLDEAAWKVSPVYGLRELETGRPAGATTSFRMFWDNNSLYLGIQCRDLDTSTLRREKGPHDDGTVWNGDCVEILLETQTHSYYQFAIDPAGTLVDLDRENGLNTLWQSGAQVVTHISDTDWTIEMRLPIAAANQDELDPLHGIAATKPSETYPWYFNICRQRLRPNGDEFSAFSPTGVDHFHELLKFAAFWVR